MFNPFSALTSKIYGVIAIAALTFGAIQTVRIDGLLFIDGYVDKLADARATIAQMEQASKDATAAQIALNAERTKKDTNNAKQSDLRYITAQAAASDATARYIDRWRVRPNSCASETDSPAQSSNSEIPDAMSARTVLVSERDVQACSAATGYAIEAHNHAASLIAEGLAVTVE